MRARVPTRAAMRARCSSKALSNRSRCCRSPGVRALVLRWRHADGKRRERGRKLFRVRVRFKVEETAHGEEMLRQRILAPHVDRGIALAFRIQLDSDSDAVSAMRLDEMVERQYAFVDDAALGDRAEHAREIGALQPELRCACQFAEEVWDRVGRP